MRLAPICAAALLFAVLAGAGRAQEVKFRVRYFESEGRTEIDTGALTLLRDPARMLEIGLFASHPTKRLSAPPDAVVLRFWSFGHGLQHQRAEQRVLIVATDGESWQPAAAFNYLPLTPAFKRENPKRAGAPPEKADFRFVEVVDVRINFAQLSQLARARQVRVQLGDVVADFDQRTLEIFRAFVERVTPGPTADAAAPPRVVPGVPNLSLEPSEFGDATLEEALNFLKKELKRNAAKDQYKHFEVTGIKGCEIKYRLVPTSPLTTLTPPNLPDPRPPLSADDRRTPPTESSVNLADLDHSTVRISPDGAFVRFSTRGGEKKIRHSRRGEDWADSAGLFQLRPTRSATQIGHALVRAIQLCQQARP